jgi:hypothetical protein
VTIDGSRAAAASARTDRQEPVDGAQPAIEVLGLRRSFGPVNVLRGVDLEVLPEAVLPVGQRSRKTT